MWAMQQSTLKEGKVRPCPHLWLVAAVAACCLSTAQADVLPLAERSVVRPEEATKKVPTCKEDTDCGKGEKCSLARSGRMLCQDHNCENRGGSCQGACQHKFEFDEESLSGCGKGDVCCNPFKANKTAGGNHTAEPGQGKGAAKGAVKGAPKKVVGNLASEVESDVEVQGTVVQDEASLPLAKESVVELACVCIVASISFALHQRIGGVEAARQDFGTDEEPFLE